MTPEQVEEHADHIVRTYAQGFHDGLASLLRAQGDKTPDEVRHFAAANAAAMLGDPAVREMILQSQRDALAGRPWTEARMIKPHVVGDQP